ncbi:MAG: site-specific DNA-methyltransferase [Myxococcales bacterium]|nr:MAG: site-specific DNA-methyltransferase [Myxococcales bacterium]
MFRWRGWKKFYKAHQLREGDRVSIARAGRAVFRVTPIRTSLLDENDPSPATDDTSQEKAILASNKRRADRNKRRCNELDGATWLQFSLSVWNDIRKTPEETKLKHPAMFPSMLVDRLIRTFMRGHDRVVLDPFAGSGSTLVAAREAGKDAVGFELSPQYVALTQTRLNEPGLNAKGSVDLRQGDAGILLGTLDSGSIDFCVTSPPYWDILNQLRSADGKPARHYGNLSGDLGTIASYTEFLDALGDIFGKVLNVLKAGAYCCVIVMDLRKRDRFFPFHADLSNILQRRGFAFDDLIIWSRGHEYNNLRPLGYPYRFRINKIHEYILIFQKPA